MSAGEILMIRSTTAAIAALAIMFSAGAASAQKVDANGRCHDASGKFAKDEVCGGVSASKTAKTTTSTSTSTTKTAKASKPATSAMASGTPAAATAPAAKTTTTTS